jgi:hypothetical protein
MAFWIVAAYGTSVLQHPLREPGAQDRDNGCFFGFTENPFSMVSRQK